jgi:tripartite ATP-independent transporter DctP family solute receptor
MKRLITLSLALVFIWALTSTASAAKWNIKFGHDHKETSPHHKAALWMKEQIEKGSNGEIAVEIFPSQLLGTGIQMVEMVQTGALQLLAVPTSNVQVIHPPLQILGLPFLFTSSDKLYEALDGDFGKELYQPLAKNNIQGLVYWESGFKEFTCNSPIRKPADMVGKKFRIMPSPVIREQFKALGASPVPIDFQELYNALQQGVVDGQENPLMAIVTMKFYEVQKYVTLSNHAWLGYLVMINKPFLESLPDKYQKLITETAIASGKYERALLAEEQQGFLKTIKDSGTEVIEISPEVAMEFQKKVQPVYQWFEQNIEGGKQYLDKIR